MLDKAEMVLKDLRQQKVDTQREEAFFASRRGKIEMSIDPLTSRRYLERSLYLYQELGDATNTALITTALGHVERYLGNYQLASELAQKSLDAHKASGNRSGMADALLLLGLIEIHRGRLVEAKQAHQRSYSLYRELGIRSIMPRMAGTLASTLCWSGDFAAARTITEEGLQLANEVGTVPSGLVASMAHACIHLGRYDEAQEYAKEALTIANATGVGQNRALTALGLLSLVSAAYGEAVTQFKEATAILSKHGNDIWYEPLVFKVFVLRKLGQRFQARRVLTQALQENLKPRAFFVVVNALPIAAQLMVDEGNVQRALELYTLAYRHPYVANSCWFADVIGQHLEVVAASLPPEEVATAQKRGQELDLWETAASLPAELSKQD